jgi:putative hydrolase
MKKNNPLNEIDLHVHSVVSGHAANTIYELAREASRKNLKLIAITDHGPSLDGGPDKSYFWLAVKVPLFLYKTQILMGCEANIALNGSIDLDKNFCEMQDIIIAGIHDVPTYPKNTSVRQNTNAIIKCMKNKYVDIITHPYRESFPVDVKAIVKASIENNVLLEVNDSIFRLEHTSKTIKNTQKMVDMLKSYSRKFVINSDTHIANELGLKQNAMNALNINHNLVMTHKDILKFLLEKRYRPKLKCKN